MKNYKLFANMLLAALCICLASCNKEEVEKPTSGKITTGEVSQITTHSAILAGNFNEDIKGYNSIELGIMLSDNLQDLNDRTGEIALQKTLNGTKYAIELDDLEDNTQYYYCAFVLLNGIQYEYGAIKNFTTKELVTNPRPFRVSDSKHVYFSKGNLRDDWSFAKHQYEMNSSYLFYKSSNDYSDNFIDLGNNVDDDYTWYTLTSNEWDYLLNKRYEADELIGVARIQFRNEKYTDGLILLPDSRAIPEGLTFKSGFSSYAGFTRNIYTISEWQEMELKGAIFLPTTNTYNDSEYGTYGTATHTSDHSYFMEFTDTGASIIYYWDIDDYAIRLVRTSN